MEALSFDTCMRSAAGATFCGGIFDTSNQSVPAIAIAPRVDTA
jgi:hypothetical protein